MFLLAMSIPQNDMLGSCPLYDYQTNGIMMRDIVTTAHRNLRFHVTTINLFVSSGNQTRAHTFLL